MGAAFAAVIVVGWLVFGSALSACCIAMYGDAANPCRAKDGKPMSAQEEKENSAKWIAGAAEASQRCQARVDGLLAGDVFVADPDPSPRGRELLANECAPFSAAQLERFKDPVIAPPLQTTNPSLCDALAKGMRPEGFALRSEGGTLYFYYFTYTEAGGALRVNEVLSKIAMNPASLLVGSPPRMGPACILRPVDGTRDLGSAALYGMSRHDCFQGLALDGEDKERARFWLCHSGATFRRSRARMETNDGG